MNKEEIFKLSGATDKESYDKGWRDCLEAHKRLNPDNYTKWGLYKANLLVGLSQCVNTLIGGDPDETISSRIGKLRKSAEEGTWTKWFLNIANQPFVWFMGEEDHWYSAIEYDKGYRAVWWFEGERRIK